MESLWDFEGYFGFRILCFFFLILCDFLGYFGISMEYVWLSTINPGNTFQHFFWGYYEPQTDAETLQIVTKT